MSLDLKGSALEISQAFGRLYKSFPDVQLVHEITGSSDRLHSLMVDLEVVLRDRFLLKSVLDLDDKGSLIDSIDKEILSLMSEAV